MHTPVREAVWASEQGKIISFSLLDEPDLSLPSALAPIEMGNDSGPQLMPAPDHADDTFIRYLLALDEANALNQQTTFLCTANSAVPIADVLRGVFDGLERPRPTIAYIKANSWLSNYGSRAPGFQGEVQRLRPVVATTGQIAIIDQLQFTGKTMAYAALLIHTALQACDIRRPIHTWAIRGDWYGDFAPEEVLKTHGQSDYVDYAEVSVPALRHIMHTTGAEVAKALQGIPHLTMIRE